MRAVKQKDSLYKEAERLSRTQGTKVEELIPRALKQGLNVLNERQILELYKDRKITLQKAAAMLSIDFWEMIDRVKKADLHLGYTFEELAEDLK